MKTNPHPIEPLESRIAPATLVGNVLRYTDLDGDKVTLTISKGALDIGMFQFDSANAMQQLQIIDLTSATGVDGANIIVKVKRSGAGDGFVNIGSINATGRDLGKVTIPGDLGGIDAGNISGITPSVKSLSVRSMGLYGMTTGAPDLQSNFVGGLGRLTVATDVKDVLIDGVSAGGGDGTIGTVFIGGSLIGGLTLNSGSLLADDGIGFVTIKGDIIGGAGKESGMVLCVQFVAGVKLGGSLIGGAGDGSGELGIGRVRGPITIGGNIVAGTGVSSGVINGGLLTSVTVGGSLVGGPLGSGSIRLNHIMGPIKIGGNVQGGAGDDSGKIYGASELGDVTIGGSLIGGADQKAGSIFSLGPIGDVKIGHDILGGTNDNTGWIYAGERLESVRVGGSVIGGTGDESGGIFSSEDLGTVFVGGDVVGGGTPVTGYIFALDAIGGVTIGGSLIGTASSDTGEVSSEGDIGFVAIGGDLIGGSISGTAGTVTKSGFVHTEGRIDRIHIGGSIISGIDASTAGSLRNNASIRTGDDIGSLTVAGGLAGNFTSKGDSPVIVSARGQHTQGATTDLAIGKISIGHGVEFVQILAGYDTGLTPFNADAQIGRVHVGGDWAASSIVAGVINLGGDNLPGGSGADADNVQFGDSRDAKINGPGITDNAGITSKISKITVAGQVFALPVSVGIRHCGFVSEEVGALKIGSRAYALTPGTSQDGFAVGSTNAAGPFNSTILHEVGSALSHTLTGGAAVLIGKTSVMFSDEDGDLVTVKLSKPVLTAGNVNDVFKFNSLQMNLVNSGVPGNFRLLRLDLDTLATNGVGVTISVKPGKTGDGLANVGYINSMGFDLGAVSIAGDLGQIDAGSNSATVPAIASLKVRTMGRLGLDTQPSMSVSFTPELVSDIHGALGKLIVTADVKDATINVGRAIGSVKIGGSLMGGARGGSGLIGAGEIGAVRIGGDLLGGSGDSSGQISCSSSGLIRIGGSLVGGSGDRSGYIFADSGLSSVSVGGNMIGGTEDRTGHIEATGIRVVTIGGSLVGRSGTRSGSITAYDADGLGTMNIGGNLLGGSGNESGKIDSSSDLTSLTIRGSLVGGVGRQNTIVSGSVVHEAQVFAFDGIESLKIGGNVSGSGGTGSGEIRSRGLLASVSIAGSLVGGKGFASGQIAGETNIGSLKIGGDVAGGSSQFTGFIVSSGALASVTIGGSLFAGTANNTGELFAVGDIGKIAIGRDVVGTSISGTQAGRDETGYIQGARLGSLTIGGSLIAGSDTSTGGALTHNGSVRVSNDLGPVVIRGSVLGNAGDGAGGNITFATISARGQETLAPGAKSDVALKSLSIGGRVALAKVLAGFGPDDADTAGKNGNASIGKVSVGGNWFASTISAGVEDGNNTGFGDAGDNVINQPAGAATDALIARIARIAIKGVVAGAPNPFFRCGFVAQQIGAFQSAGFTAPLTAATDAPIILTPTTANETIVEFA